MGPTLYKSILETNGALLRYWRGDILAISSFHLHVTYFIFVVPSCKQSPSDILQGLKHASAAKHFRDRRVKTMAPSKVSPSFQHTKFIYDASKSICRGIPFCRGYMLGAMYYMHYTGALRISFCTKTVRSSKSRIRLPVSQTLHILRWFESFQDPSMPITELIISWSVSLYETGFRTRPSGVLPLCVLFGIISSI